MFRPSNLYRHSLIMHIHNCGVINPSQNPSGSVIQSQDPEDQRPIDNNSNSGLLPIPRKVIHIQVDSPPLRALPLTSLIKQCKHPISLKFDSTACSQRISSQTHRDLYYITRMSSLGDPAALIATQPTSGTCSIRMGGMCSGYSDTVKHICHTTTPRRTSAWQFSRVPPRLDSV